MNHLLELGSTKSGDRCQKVIFCVSANIDRLSKTYPDTSNNRQIR